MGKESNQIPVETWGLYTQTHTSIDRSILFRSIHPPWTQEKKLDREFYLLLPIPIPLSWGISIGKKKFPSEKKRKSPIIEDVNLHPSTYTEDISISLDNATHSKWNEQTISELCDDSNLIFKSKSNYLSCTDVIIIQVVFVLFFSTIPIKESNGFLDRDR